VREQCCFPLGASGVFVARTEDVPGAYRLAFETPRLLLGTDAVPVRLLGGCCANRFTVAFPTNQGENHPRYSSANWGMLAYPADPKRPGRPPAEASNPWRLDGGQRVWFLTLAHDIEGAVAKLRSLVMAGVAAGPSA
jgi:hypothetical protein